MRQDPTSPAPPTFRGRGMAPRRRGWIAVAAVAIGTAALAPAAVAEREAWLGAHPRVPNLIGKTVAEAARIVMPLHFGVIVGGTRQDPAAPVGTVLAQTPPPGRRVAARSVLQLRVSQGSGIVPLLRGDPVNTAAERLEAIGLRLGRVHYIDDDAQPDTVLEQFTPPGRQLGANGSVDVLVSQGPAAGTADQPPAAAPSAPAATVPSTAAPSLGNIPTTIILGPIGPETEGSARVGSTPGGCPTDPQRKRAEVCGEPADDPGTQPDLYRREHRDVPPGP